MALSHENLLTLMSLPGIGIKKGFIMANYAESQNLDHQSLHDLMDVIMYSKVTGDFSYGRYSFEDLVKAGDKAHLIMDKSEQLGIKLVSYYDPQFPQKLKTITAKGKNASPLLLWYKGNLDVCKMPGVAIIGTREPTPEGVKTGEWLGKTFAESGFNVVSGLAYGCDKSGHVGALKAENGITTAFLAHGLDTCYPAEHAYLAEEIVERGGLLMSEYAVGTRGLANFFVERDRLQSGLSDACIVIQTGIKGGTLHAVRATVENNKPLFAVEYSDPAVMTNPKVTGNSMLLNTGICPEGSTRYVKAHKLTSHNVQEVIDSLTVMTPESKTMGPGEATEVAEPLKIDVNGQLELF